MRHASHQFLCSPPVILAEIVAITLASTAGAIWPERTVFRSGFFLALVSLTALSLTVIVSIQLRVLARIGVTIRRLGSLTLHMGLVCIIIAGLTRVLFATEAVVDLIENETLPPSASAWHTQNPGWLAKPFHFLQPVTLEAVHGQRHLDGSLSNLTAKFSVGEVAVNHDLAVPGGRLFLSSEFGPAALLKWNPGKREATLLNPVSHEATSIGPNGLRAYLRATRDRPDHIDVRVLRGNGLLAAGQLRPGQTLPLTGGESLTLHGLPLWVRLHGSRDHSVWLAYLGFTLILLGSILLFSRLPGGPRPVAATTLLLMALPLTSCHRAPSTDDARQLVLHYNTTVAEAYRRADPSLIDPVVGPNEGKKLTGLIGVRQDLGLTLDSQLLTLDITTVTRSNNTLLVATRERWRYCDRRIGSGEKIGNDILDSYDMFYVFIRRNQNWVVDEIHFISPPKIGRTQPAWLETRNTNSP